MSQDQGLAIDYRILNENTLLAVIEAFVMQEGTDYGPTEYSLESKVQAVKKQLQNGKAELVFDAENQTCSIRRLLC